MHYLTTYGKKCLHASTSQRSLQVLLAHGSCGYLRG